jgi:hypothetical protein
MESLTSRPNVSNEIYMARTCEVFEESVTGLQVSLPLKCVHTHTMSGGTQALYTLYR